MELKPVEGFDWTKLNWGRPDSVRSVLCSYCCAVLTEDEVPLILSNAEGWTVQFCEKCCETFWNMR